MHDAVGSVTDDGEVQYAYDARGRMVRASIGGCTVARYRVNALGQRVRKQTWPVSPCQPAVPTDPPQKDTLYTYDLAGHLIAENHTYGVYKRAYVYLGDWPVAMLFQSDD